MTAPHLRGVGLTREERASADDWHGQGVGVRLYSGPQNARYSAGWERTFGKRKKPTTLQRVDAAFQKSMQRVHKYEFKEGK